MDSTFDLGLDLFLRHVGAKEVNKHMTLLGFTVEALIDDVDCVVIPMPTTAWYLHVGDHLTHPGPLRNIHTNTYSVWGRWRVVAIDPNFLHLAIEPIVQLRRYSTQYLHQDGIVRDVSGPVVPNVARWLGCQTLEMAGDQPDEVFEFIARCGHLPKEATSGTN